MGKFFFPQYINTGIAKISANLKNILFSHQIFGPYITNYHHINCFCAVKELEFKLLFFRLLKPN